MCFWVCSILDGIFFCVYTNRVHKLSITSNKLSVPVLCFFFALQRRLLSPRSDFQQECDDFMEEILLFKMYKEKSRLFIRSRNRKIFYKMLSKAERRLRSRKIARCALHMPAEIAWAKLYGSEHCPKWTGRYPITPHESYAGRKRGIARNRRKRGIFPGVRKPQKIFSQRSATKNAVMM